MKKVYIRNYLSIIMAFVLFLTAFVSVAFAEEASLPIFSQEGGIYAEGFKLSITSEKDGERIYYTLDGSEPSEKSILYTSPIEISNEAHSPRIVQNVVPQMRMEQGIVVKAICINAMNEKSAVVTNTYFISDTISEIAQNIPIVALSAEPYDIWDMQNGIYANYNYEHNVPAYVEYIDNNGDGFERGVELKVSGHGSRSNAKKSLRIYFTKGDAEGKKNIEYSLIDGTLRNFYDTSEVAKYAKTTLRISDWTQSDLKDVVAQRFAEFVRPDSANSEPAAVFINGEFWGVYECREQYDDRYIDYHYEGIDKEDIVFLDRDWTNENFTRVSPDTGKEMTDRLSYENGPEEDEDYYMDLFMYIKQLMVNASDDEVYSELCANIDIDNFMDYFFLYLYCDNIDWPGNNFKFWRTNIERSNGDVYAADGKWRFMVHDFDLAFDGVQNNTLEYAMNSKYDDNNARQPKFAIDEMRGIFSNETFRNEFAQRAAAYMSVLTAEDNMQKIVDELVADRETTKALDLLRWNNQRGTSAQRVQSWKEYTQSKFITFAEQRNDVFYKMIADYLKKYYSSTVETGSEFTFDIDSNLASAVVSGAVVRSDFYADKAEEFTTKQYKNIPIEISAETKEGYVVKSITINSQKYESESVEIIPTLDNYSVSFEIAEGESEHTTEDYFILRKDYFNNMCEGDKLSIDIAEKNGDKLFGFTAVTDSDCITIGDNNIITANTEGTANVTIDYKGIVKQFNVTVQGEN